MPTTTQRTPAPSAASALPRGLRLTLIPPTLTLALARLRKTWRLLLVTELGLVGAVLLISAVPLFSQVAVSSGLRGALAAAPGGPVLDVMAFAFRPTSDAARQAGPRVDDLVRQRLGPYLAGKPSFSVQTSFGVTKQAPSSAAPRQGLPDAEPFGLSLDGRDMGEAASHLKVLRGRLPAASTPQIEVALPQAAVDAHGVKVGDTLDGLLPSDGPQPASTPLRVVGVYALASANDPYWSDPNAGNGRGVIVGPGFAKGEGGGGQYTALASADTVLAVVGKLAEGSSSQGGGLGVRMTWRYPLALDHISSSDLSALTDQYGRLGDQLNNRLPGQEGVQGFNLGGALDTLAIYQGRAIGMQIVVIILLLQVLGLVILFVSLSAGILVERQGEAIALLRSRGAHRRQILGALASQGLAASLVALVAGPLLAIPVVRLIAGALLPPAAQRGLSVLDRDPFALAWDVRWYALIAVIGAAVAILVSIVQAANRNVLALRRESARAGVPFWQRLNLDLIAAAFLVAIYGFYLWGIQQVSVFVRFSLAALGIIMPLLLLVAIALVFGRVFPLALRLAARAAARRSGAASSLALAQMARAPRQSSRMLLLLSLSTAFTLFALILTVSQATHVADLTAFQAGADFAGTLSADLTTPAAPATPPTIAGLTGRYAAITGVRAASVGYQGMSSSQQGQGYSVVAVDADTYAGAALWSPKYSGQSLGALTKALADWRAGAKADGVIPAVVDDALWTHLNLTADGRFTLPFDGRDGRVKFIAVARVAHIPPVADAPDLDFGASMGAMLVDYSTFAAIYTQGQAASVATPAPNTAWLRTDDDAGALAAVRAALTAGDLKLTDLLDRRQLLDDARSDPLQFDLTGALGLGAITALTLALVGAWTASWLNARSRLTNFAVLRAIGATPRQILSLLLWEQGIVYGAALALGLGLGLLLAQAALPALILTSALARVGVNGGPPIDVPPVAILVPTGPLALVLGGLAAVCVVAVALTTFAISRASLGEALRLNQD